MKLECVSWTQHADDTLGGDLRGVSVSGVRIPQAHVDQEFVHVAALAEITNEYQENNAQDAVAQPRVPLGALTAHSGNADPLCQESVELIIPHLGNLTFLMFAQEG